MTSLCHNSGHVCVCVSLVGLCVCVFVCTLVRLFNGISISGITLGTRLCAPSLASFLKEQLLTVTRCTSQDCTRTQIHTSPHTQTHKELSNFRPKKSSCKEGISLFSYENVAIMLLFYACICLRLCPRCVAGT